jgi:tRNA(fMet)-specific endonuclease VapC
VPSSTSTCACAYDRLVAGQALRRGLKVVTANTSEFSRLTGLSWQD